MKIFNYTYKYVLFLLIWTTGFGHIIAQDTQHYTVSFEFDQDNFPKTELDTTSRLNIGKVTHDSIIIHCDTSYLNRTLEFDVAHDVCNDLSVYLRDKETLAEFGIRILTDELFIVADEIVVSPPFSGENSQMQVVTFSGLKNEISNYKIEYVEPEMHFYLNDVLIYKTCQDIPGKNFEHILIPRDSTSIETTVKFVQW